MDTIKIVIDLIVIIYKIDTLLRNHVLLAKDIIFPF